MIRLGIIGTARIARALFQHPLQDVTIAGVASRSESRAKAFAQQYGIPRWYGGYEPLLEDRDIDAVYIPLPPFLHCEYSVKAARAGKHVLVEKPAALGVSEVRRMIAACKKHQVILMEGLMYRFQTIQNRVKEIVHSGTIGAVRYIDFNWCFNAAIIGRLGFRMDKASGGGSLYDLGIYGIDFIRFMLDGSTPELLSAYTYRKNTRSVDEFTHAVFRVGDAVAAVTCGYDTDANYYTISGEKGAIHVPRGVAARPVDTLLRVHLLEGDQRYEEHFPAENSYIRETEYFAQCIESHRQPVPGGENSFQNLKLLGAVFRESVPIRRPKSRGG